MMPAAVPPPLTSRQAKRRHQNSSRGFKFTPSQERAAARRNQKEEYARKLRERDERAKYNKRKRDEKEEKEREAKRRLIETGKLPQDALLPKVSASQPRLSIFIRQLPDPTSKPLSSLATCDDNGKTVRAASLSEEDMILNHQRLSMDLPVMDETELEGFFSTPPVNKEELAVKEPCRATDKEFQRPAVFPANNKPQRATTDPEPSDLDAQLGCRLSPAPVEFEICQDPLSESELALIVTPSPRKRKCDQDNFATPSKSARSALSDMSPGKVLLRSREKPDMTSAPSIAACMMSPENQRPRSNQLIQETFAMISTQDLADDFSFSDEKENTDPGRTPSSQQRKTKLVQEQGVAGSSNTSSANDSNGTNEFVFDDSVFQGFMDIENPAESDELQDFDEIDEFDNGLEDVDWAGLSTQKPKNTAVSTFGSPKKAKDVPAKAPTRKMAPPPCPSPFATVIQKLKATSPRRQQLAQPTVEYGAPSSSQNYSFSEDLEEDMLALVDEVDFAGSFDTKTARRGRTLPWTRRPANCAAQMADGDGDEVSERVSQCDT